MEKNSVGLLTIGLIKKRVEIVQHEARAKNTQFKKNKKIPGPF